MKYTVDQLDGAIIGFPDKDSEKYLLRKGTKNGHLDYICTYNNQVYLNWNTANYISELIENGEYLIKFPNLKRISYEVYN